MVHWTRTLLSIALLTATARAGEPFAFTERLSDCENRWAVLPPKAGSDAFIFGFVYVDPQAGFTFHPGGTFKLDAEGRYVRVPDAIDGKVILKARIDAAHNGRAAVLPEVGRKQLGLPEAPEWLGMYADHDDPVAHRVTWGRHYNGVGAPQRALALLEPAYRERPHAAGLEFELAFAYNALERFDEAIAVLRGAVARRPDDALLGGELGFAYLHAGKLELAVEQYLRSISLCDDRQPVVKSEMAMNLSLAYERLGDAANVQKWRAKAKAWAPPGSAVFKHFNP